MRSCMLCVYWTLLLISAISSGLLFLIVASESTQVKDPSFHLEKNETYTAYNNTTLNYDNSEGRFDSSVVVKAKVQNVQEPNTSQNDHYQEEAASVSASFEAIISDNAQMEKGEDIWAESLTQQPNLSQGISETGQAVVLTLVDTAAAELQSLAEPKINRELSSRSSVKNSSLFSDNVEQPEHLKETPPTQIPPPPIVEHTAEQPNDTTDHVVEQEEVLVLKNISEETPEVVVIVRAEQKVNVDELELRVEKEDDQVVSEELPKVDDTFTTAPELNDSAARAQLVGDSRKDIAAVILDGVKTRPFMSNNDPPEDIPSFNEWSQKRLEEAEKKKPHPNASVQTPGGPGRGVSGMKVRSKNYASPECGAKIVAANPEASNARNVLVSNRDEYMLNTCTSRVWFVVELCEAIQAKKIELANFELYSSSPKDFSVYVSDRFPTRDWSSVGQFAARDVKDIQSFRLHPHLFGKFIKIELQSHYGSEHYCPVSLFRVYGTSEFEALETETEDQVLQKASADEDDEEDSDEEELLDSEGADSSRIDLFGSVQVAVVSILKKAAGVLVKSSDLSGNNITEIQQSIDGDNILDNSYANCMTPRYTILCANCTDQKFASVFQLVSCRHRQLDGLLRIDLVNRTLRRSRLCYPHGVEIESFWSEREKMEEEQLIAGMRKRRDTTRYSLAQDLRATFLASVFKPEYIVALCNVLATKERKVVMNTSSEISANASEDATREDVSSAAKSVDRNSEVAAHRQATTTCALDSNSPACKITSSGETRRFTTAQDGNEETERDVSTTFIETAASTESLASQIKPTKTLSKDFRKDSSVPILEPSKEITEETLQVEALTTVPPPNLPTPTVKIVEDPPPVAGTSIEIVSQTVTSIPLINLDNQEASDAFVPDAESAEPASQARTERSAESVEQEVKQATKDSSEQEVKLPSQDQFTLDVLPSDLKDFESDATNMQNGSASPSSMTQPTTASAVPQKENVFLRLSNRIKALETNMSLSGQYLEELSQLFSRYKKQVEEMQRSLEHAISAISEESRKGEEREARRVEEIVSLREEIAVLSKSVETILHDRDSSWHLLSTIAQHALLTCLELIVIFLIFSYCRRTGDFEEKEELQLIARNESARRKKIERKKKRKKEAAAEFRIDRITIDSDAKREAVRYRSVLSMIPGGSTLPSRRASSIDPPRKNSQDSSNRRPESAPETVVDILGARSRSERIERIAPPASADKPFGMEFERSSDPLSRQINDRLSESNSSSATVDRSIEEGSATVERRVENSKNGSFRTGNILKGARLSSPSFMKTALGARSKRKLSSNNERWDWNRDSERTNDRSALSSPTGLNAVFPSRIIDSVNGSAANGLIEESDESRSSSGTPTSGKKEKKSTGLRKMVRKFF